MCNLNELTKDDIEYAIKKYKEIEQKGKLNSKRKSKDYYLLLENKYFPPKYIVAIACDIKNEIEVSYKYKYKFIAAEAINILERLGFIIKKEDSKMNDMIGEAIEKFINSLKENNDNIPGFGIKMETPKRKDIFYVFRDKKRNIIIRPLNGTAQFSQSIPAIKRYIQHREPTHPVYIQPIGEYIIEKYIKEIPLPSPKLVKNKVKNIILYGSPGVGKTHNTKKLISLIESGISEKEIFEIIKNNELNDVVDIDAIKDRVKFITFHQSFGYEDFIEGFRPNEEGNIKLVEGVFKSICNDSAGTMKLTAYLSINREIHSERSTYIIDGITNDLIKIKKVNGDKIVPIPTKLVIELLEHIQSSDLTLDDIKYRNLDQVQMSFDKYMYGYNSILYAICKSVIEEEKISEQKNYYLVIDEINRGNISKIFGELITLIEEDKRDTLEVTLPYSKKPFKIPSNLYIIGTMNSTDKSIALIDIALRRRFTFLKMKPNIDLVDNLKAKNIMKKLNEKITETLGADYVLGHSYFMKIENDDDLDFVLEYKIKPLLEEYFYGDEQGLKSVMKIVRYDGDGDTE